jgi:superfamily II DNA or RNA helicase
MEPAQLTPRVGMLATVRNRRAVIAGVDPYDHPSQGRLHVVTVEYVDSDGTPDDRLIWERETGAELVAPRALPNPATDAPMPHADFDALVRATRWTALTPFVDPDDDGPIERLPITAPYHGAVEVEDFQLVPLLKALQMPRISLLIADDVGLGKTVEAGLILQELVLRRRVRRVLVLCPASLRSQWVQELRDKFSLSVDEVDREVTHALRKRLGLDANPWRTFPRIVASYHYLRQADVLEEFRADAAARSRQGAVQLPWDLLIVDEAHNLAPSAFGEDSDLARMLRAIAPFFEHKLFLTATPHNGHTRSFTGLLESLDPVRFSRTSNLTDAERGRLGDVLVRRLKKDINARTNPPRFAQRLPPRAIQLRLHPDEAALSAAFRAFRKRVGSLVAKSGAEQAAGKFAVEVLNKRLLSSPVAFADSWLRYTDGLAGDDASVREVVAARAAVAEETGDDREAEGRTAHAAQTVGAWMRPLAEALSSEGKAIDDALHSLGLDRRDVEPHERAPRHDARFEALCAWIDFNLRSGQAFRDDERLILFTEYKTTLDSLHHRLRAKYPEPGALRVLFGTGMDAVERDAIKDAFNNPADAVRVLLATDAASEGLNLQETARYVLHYDVPWNPARLEQRNGRLDRHGQARDVTVHHFTTDDDADLAFLSYVVGKVEAIREDLGAMGDVFDLAFEQALVDGEERRTVQTLLDRRVDQARERAKLPLLHNSNVAEMGEAELARLEALGAELDLDPQGLRDTLDMALGMSGRGSCLSPIGDDGCSTLRTIPVEWDGVVADSLRIGTIRGQVGRLPRLAFDPHVLIDTSKGRPVFRPRRDVALIHLAHPIYHRALASFARARFPGAELAATRWTVRRAELPKGVDALILVVVEELAVNELRETFHHWARTLAFPLRSGEVGDALGHRPARAWRAGAASLDANDVRAGRDIWSEVGGDLRGRLQEHARAVSEHVRSVLGQEAKRAVKTEQERFRSRQGELSALIEDQRRKSVQKRIEELTREQGQLAMFDGDRQATRLAEQRILEEELVRRERHYEELRDQLNHERERVVDQLLPRRYAMRGDAQVFPVAIEIRLPGGTR